MASSAIRPFFIPNQKCIQPDAWVQGDRSVEADGLVAGWDPGTFLEVRRGVRVEADLLAATARLPVGTELSLVPAWWCESAATRGKGDAIRLQVGVPVGPCQIRLRIPGDQIAGTVKLRTLLLLQALPMDLPADPLRAHRPGSILWEDAILLRLDEEEPRFPVASLDFALLGWPAGAAWILKVDPHDLSRPVGTALRLHLNQRHSAHAILSQVGCGTGAMLRHGLAVELLSMALDQADPLERFQAIRGTGPDGGEGDSLGDLLLALLQLAAPGISPTRAASWRREDPGGWHAAVQAAFRPTEDL